MFTNLMTISLEFPPTRSELSQLKRLLVLTRLFRLLSFTNAGTGDTHSFTTNFINNLRVKVDSNVVTVSTQLLTVSKSLTELISKSNQKQLLTLMLSIMSIIEELCLTQEHSLLVMLM